MIFKLDTKSRLPMYEQLENLISKYILLGVLEADEKLPSVRTMAKLLGINPNTVAKSYKSLESKGIIYTISGKGVYVSEGDAAAVHLKKENIARFRSAVKSAKTAKVEKDVLIQIIENEYEGGNKDD